MKNTYKQFSCEERDKIAVLRAKGLSLANIAEAIDRIVSSSVIYFLLLFIFKVFPKKDIILVKRLMEDTPYLGDLNS